ncbi:MAG: YafY family protein [Bacteroidota bacterium]
MGVDTLKRFDRIMALMIQLQTRRVVKAQDLADRFQVSLRTIYRDIRTLEASGVPIASEAGIGYSVMEGYRLPPIMFTREEASSFVAAEKLMQQFTDKTLGAYHESAMYKVKSVLRGREKDWIAALESNVKIDTTQDLFNENVPDSLEILFESIAEKKQVFLTYLSIQSEEPKERMMEPVGLFHENNYWYIIGYCHFRKDYRQFRTDRIVKIKRTEMVFSREHGTIDEYRDTHKDIPKTRVKILVDKKIARLLTSEKKRYGFISQKTMGSEVEMTFMTSNIDQGFPRWYLMFGDYAKIVEPIELKERVVQLLQQTKERLQ